MKRRSFLAFLGGAAAAPVLPAASAIASLAPEAAEPVVADMILGGGRMVIDGSMIKTGTIYASRIAVGSIKPVHLEPLYGSLVSKESKDVRLHQT